MGHDELKPAPSAYLSRLQLSMARASRTAHEWSEISFWLTVPAGSVYIVSGGGIVYVCGEACGAPPDA
eukprot:4044862-Prymnesium_polylepis.1